MHTPAHEATEPLLYVLPPCEFSMSPRAGVQAVGLRRGRRGLRVWPGTYVRQAFCEDGAPLPCSSVGRVDGLVGAGAEGVDDLGDEAADAFDVLAGGVRRSEARHH